MMVMVILLLIVEMLYHHIIMLCWFTITVQLITRTLMFGQVPPARRPRKRCRSPRSNDGPSLKKRLLDIINILQVWNRTDNTASNNFLISSANEGRQVSSQHRARPSNVALLTDSISAAAAVALEAIRSRTAVYSDNDPREAASQYVKCFLQCLFVTLCAGTRGLGNRSPV